MSVIYNYGVLGVPSPTKMIVAGTPDNPTIQSAIQAAEALSESANWPIGTLPPHGVGVFVPAGYYNEDIVIHKNVSICGQGRENTRIKSITVRPLSALVYPQSISICNLATTGLVTLTYDNGSGVKNYTMGIEIDSCDLDNITTRAIQTLYVTNCVININSDTLGPSIIDTNTNTFIQNCRIYEVLHKSDPGVDPSLPTDGSVGIGFTQIVNQVTTEKLSGPVDALPGVSMTFCDCSTVNLGNNTQSGFYNCWLGSIIPGVTNVSYHVETPAFLMTTPANWNTAPTDVGSALNELAARVKALNG